MLDLQKVNEYYLTYEDAVYLIREWNHYVRTYGKYKVSDLKNFLNMCGEEIEEEYVDCRYGWLDVLEFNRGLTVEVGAYSVRVKLDLKPYRELY